ncbi:NADH-quinone oxidoreductase subunit NuoN [Gordonia sp. (in: high G+C Gram-positive bacteria)]|uniref:NADH-quinone oxidoreductase subunit NuoN n=1 Tax=Gordonia sp. (in: high G+C Gram-positive bacteria) TaxID=84139 RepID=UPI002626BBF5|nr:NADH-quinone oxidoreductase subunit NuoN [Gordonia sp. (in: high G+C Gram-positive bacteria)]
MTTVPLAIDAPAIDYALLSPMLVVFGVAVLSVLVEAVLAVAPGVTGAPAATVARARHRIQVSLAIAALVIAFIRVVILATGMPTDAAATMSGAVVIDGPTLFLQGTILLVSLAAVAFMAERRLDRVWAPVEVRTAAGRRMAVVSGGGADADLPADAFTPSAATIPDSPDELLAARAHAVTTEVFPLTLFAVGGMMLFGACGDLLTMFVALEVLSLPLYLLCGLARRRRLLSQEAALKYFLLGAFASAIFLFGSAFAYGATGSLNLGMIGHSLPAGSGASGAHDAAGGSADHTLALIAVVGVSVGLLFKVGAVPFGSWVPDVYQGAPTPVTALMASATKVAAFGALLRVLHVGFAGLADDWRPALWAVAIATMVIATLMAVTQQDIKRMLAYSSVGHVGFALVGAITLTEAGISSTLFYVAAYAFAAFGGFALLSVVRDETGVEESRLDAWAGLGRRRPLVGVLLSLVVLSLARMPQTRGLIRELAGVAAAGATGAWALVIVGVLCSAVAAYFYVRVIVSMFFAPSPDDAPEVLTPSALTTVPIGVCAAVTAFVGVFPQPVLDLASSASAFLR